MPGFLNNQPKTAADLIQVAKSILQKAPNIITKIRNDMPIHKDYLTVDPNRPVVQVFFMNNKQEFSKFLSTITFPSFIIEADEFNAISFKNIGQKPPNKEVKIKKEKEKEKPVQKINRPVNITDEMILKDPRLVVLGKKPKNYYVELLNQNRNAKEATYQTLKKERNSNQLKLCQIPAIKKKSVTEECSIFTKEEKSFLDQTIMSDEE